MAAHTYISISVHVVSLVFSIAIAVAFITRWLLLAWRKVFAVDLQKLQV
jgi:hypothetical protein